MLKKVNPDGGNVGANGGFGFQERHRPNAPARTWRSPPTTACPPPGDRKGQNSIRINDQWRICFVWRDGETWDVEIVDYH
jgi:hypothetical protein